MDAKQIKMQVCELVGITDEAYAQHQYDMGLAYIQLYLHGLPHDQRWLEGNRLFWNWWKNHWTLRDAMFIAAGHQGNHYQIWMNTHDASMLAAEVTTPAIILRDSYSIMIGELIKEEVQGEH